MRLINLLARQCGKLGPFHPGHSGDHVRVMLGLFWKHFYLWESSLGNLYIYRWGNADAVLDSSWYHLHMRAREYKYRA